MGGGEKGESQGYWFRAAFGTVSRRWHSCAKGSSFPVPGGQPGNNYQLLQAPETRIAKGIEGGKGTKLYLCSAFKALSGFQITLPRQRACCFYSRRHSPRLYSKPRPPAVCSWLAVGLGTGKQCSERDYGLPRSSGVRYCRRPVYSNFRPHSKLRSARSQGPLLDRPGLPSSPSH